jgi:hypothetical protein
MNRNNTQISLKLNSGLISFLLAGLFFVFFLDPVNSQVIASFSDSQDFLLAEDGHFKTVFVLEASKESYELLVSKAHEMPETLALKSKKNKKNYYSCSIQYIHLTDAYYVKKTLLNLGIEQLRINNNIYSLPDYEPATR